MDFWPLKATLNRPVDFDFSGLQQAPAIGRAIMELILDDGYQVPISRIYFSAKIVVGQNSFGQKLFSTKIVLGKNSFGQK
jgi:hypothetical protein